MALVNRRRVGKTEGTHLWPVGRECVHVHDIEPARKAFVECLESFSEVPEALDIGEQRFCFVDEFG